MARLRVGQLTLADLILMIAIVGLLLAWIIPAGRGTLAAWPALLASAGFVAMVTPGRFRPTQILMLITATAATTVLPLLKTDYLLAKYLLTLAVLIGLWTTDPRRREGWRAEGGP